MSKPASPFTATDALALDVEQVERWCRWVVEDADAPTDALASLVVRLRSAADTIAEYLFQTSQEAQEGAGAGADAREGTAPHRTPATKRVGRDSGGGAPAPAERERAERPDGAGNLQSPTPSPSPSVGALHA